MRAMIDAVLDVIELARLIVRLIAGWGEDE